MRLHHVGIVVRNLSAVGGDWEKVLRLAPASGVFYDPQQKVRVQFWRDGKDRLLELIEPDGSDSPVTRALRKGGGLNHLCYEVDNLDREVCEAVAQGAILTGEITPAVAFQGRRVAFLFFRSLGLIEFVESPTG